MANHPWHEIGLRTQGDISTDQRIWIKVRPRVRQIKTQKADPNEILEGRIGQPQSPSEDAFAYIWEMRRSVDKDV